MSTETEQQETRVRFYNTPTVIKYLQGDGVPKSGHAFRAMVASGSSEKLDSKKGLELISTLGKVTFATHRQQINVMDKTNGKIIVSIAR